MGSSFDERARSAWRRRHAALFRRRGLARRTRHGAALSALIADGAWTEFGDQAAWAMTDGCSLSWLREVALQSYLFAGYPRAILALQALHRLRPDATRRGFLRDSGSEGSWLERGESLCRMIYGEAFDSLKRVMERTHPDLAEWMIVEGYGKVLARPHLGAKVRELCVIPILAAQACWPQYHSHLLGAFRAGARPIEVVETLRTAAAVLPGIDASTARAILRRVLA